MRRQLSRLAVIAGLVAITGAAQAAIPAPAQDEPRAAAPSSEKIVLAGGCFWGVEGVFDHVKGVSQAVAGYAGGSAATAQYETVSTGTTGHAESVEVTYDPSQVTLGQLMTIYFTVAHDPTELNRQGPDHGTQYRSEIFATTQAQRQLAESYVAQLNAAKAFDAPVVTKVEMLPGFYPAEPYHQHYLADHPYNPYIMINDAPKVAALKRDFPQFYRDQAAN